MCSVQQRTWIIKDKSICDESTILNQKSLMPNGTKIIHLAYTCQKRTLTALKIRAYLYIYISYVDVYLLNSGSPFFPKVACIELAETTSVQKKNKKMKDRPLERQCNVKLKFEPTYLSSICRATPEKKKPRGLRGSEVRVVPRAIYR